MLKTFLSKTVVLWFKRLGFAGALRWRMLYWAYKIWPGLHIRDAEWDWVLNYLPKVDKNQYITALDVGATSSLFMYELLRRGYVMAAMDIRPYQEKVSSSIFFIEHDIRKPRLGLRNGFDFITCISVLEHIDNRKEALKNMVDMLRYYGGTLLLTIPTATYAQGHPWSGFTLGYLRDILPKNTLIKECTERKGQICMAIERY